jgi:hypothetical protein
VKPAGSYTPAVPVCRHLRIFYEGNPAMELDSLMQRYMQLRDELSLAYKAQPWESGQIDRLANDLSLAEQEMAARQTGRQRGEGFSPAA